MKTLSDLATTVCTNVGRDYAAPFSNVVNEALNYAAVMAVIMFEPEELKTRAHTVQLSAGLDSISLVSGTFTNMLSITSVYNITDAKPIWFVPFELWDIIVPSTLTPLKFFTTFGTTAYFKTLQATNKFLDIYYTQYPPPMSAAADPLGFLWHEDYVVSIATGLVFTSLEETESAGNWDKVQNTVTSIMALGGMRRHVIQGRSTRLEQAVKAMQGGK
jgi:hypothetical protein